MEWERRRVEVGVCGVGEESGGGSVWDGRGGEWRWECVGWERRRVEVGVCGVGEEESGGGRVWDGRGEWRWEGVGWERRRVEVGVCGVPKLLGGREKRRPGTRLERRSKAGRFGGHRIKQFT